MSMQWLSLLLILAKYIKFREEYFVADTFSVCNIRKGTTDDGNAVLLWSDLMTNLEIQLDREKLHVFLSLIKILGNIKHV